MTKIERAIKNSPLTRGEPQTITIRTIKGDMTRDAWPVTLGIPEIDKFGLMVHVNAEKTGFCVSEPMSGLRIPRLGLAYPPTPEQSIRDAVEVIRKRDVDYCVGHIKAVTKAAKAKRSRL